MYVNTKKSMPIDVAKLSLPGHRTDVRTVSFSSDNTAILSASAEGVKIWNRLVCVCVCVCVRAHVLKHWHGIVFQ